jgi:catechol 2,3-dioxygenase-like lactoylglutathione lyase family enzyme
MLRRSSQELEAHDADFAQMPTRQSWGGTDFHVRDPDGNVISFVTYG